MESNWKSQHAQAAHEDRDKAQIDVKYPINPANMSFKTFCLCKQGKNAMLLLMSRIISNIYESKRLQSEELNGPNIIY